ncbi:MAG: PP2C family protein-serine/threonine phosphatase [Halorhodospira sp.]
MRNISLRAALAATVVAVAVATFIGVALLSSSVYEGALREQAERTAEATAVQTFNSMYQVMRRGWNRDDLQAFIAALEESYAEAPLEVTIYRGELVDDLYGSIDNAPQADPLVEQAYATGEGRHSAGDAQQRHIMPVEARSECLDCHTNAENGDVLGVVGVTQDLAPVLAQGRSSYGWLFLAVVPLALLVAAGAAHALNLRLTRSLQRFSDQVEQVNAVRDLQDLRPRSIDLGFSELNRIMASVEDLIERLRAIAADKAVLDAHQRRLEAEQETAERIVSRATAAERLDTPGIHHRYRPAAILGGDVFLAQRCSSGRYCLLLGDFTGHGIGSAVGIPALAALFHDQVRSGSAPAHLLTTLNEQLYRHLPAEIFLAAVLLEIDLGRGRLGIWNGGMPPVWLLRHGEILERLDAADLPLASAPGTVRGEPRLLYRSLQPGLELFTCSDGVIETPTPGRTPYGIEGLEATLARGPAGEAVSRVLATLEHLRPGEYPQDDTSLLGVALDELTAAGDCTQAA